MAPASPLDDDAPDQTRTGAELATISGDRALLLPDRARRQRDYLLRVAHDISSRLELREVLARVIRYAVEITGGQAGAIAMREADGTFRVVASYRLEGVYEDDLGRLTGSTPLTGSGDLETDGLPAADAAGRVVSLPLAMSGDVIGRIVLLRSDGAASFTPLDGEALQAFADQAAVAIHNAQLYAQLELSSERLRSLHDHSVAMLGAANRDEALDLTAQHALGGSGSWAAVILVDGTGDVRAGTGGPATDSLLRASLDLAHDHGMPGATAAPVPVAGDTAAVVWSGNTDTTLVAAPGDTLRTLARTLGLTLERFDLLDEVAARQRQLATVIDSHPSGILVADAHGVIRAANPASSRILGADNLAGLPLREALALRDENGAPISWDDAQVAVRGFVARGDARGPYVQVTEGPLPAGRDGRALHLVEVVDVTAVKEAEHAKTAFLSGMSHELKTPLAVIRGFAENMGYDRVRGDDHLYREGISVILAETDHLTRIVDRLLTAARLQAGAPVLNLESVDVSALLADMVESFRRVQPDRKWSFSTTGDPVVRGDEDQLREAFGNLLSNAGKFSPPGAPIEVAVQGYADGLPPGTAEVIRVAVRDHGAGIPAAEREQLFERFFRGSADVPGTGLGLYMSRAMVEAHGGRIELETPASGGSTFTVILPREGPAGAPTE